MADDLRLTDTQRTILEALCRPCTGESHFSPPATNQEIADELFLSVDAIKAHLRVLYRKFGIEPLPHNQKRARLVELAIEGGVVKAEGAPTIDSPAGAEQAADAAGHTAVAVPADAPAAADAPAQSPREVPQVKRSGRLIAAGAAIGVLVIAVVAVVLLTGGSDGSEPSTTSRKDYTSIVKRSCMQAVTQGDPSEERTRVTRAVAYSQAFDFVKSAMQDAAPPPEDAGGLTQFSTGVTDAADLNRQLAGTTPQTKSETLATISADLTIAAGNIQAGAIKYKLGGDCRALGGLAGKSAENAVGPS